MQFSANAVVLPPQTEGIFSPTDDGDENNNVAFQKVRQVFLILYASYSFWNMVGF